MWWIKWILAVTGLRLGGFTGAAIGFIIGSVIEYVLQERSKEESADATDEEVKRAYRKMALKYHPDRVATLGQDIHEEAKRQFQKINDAKDRIYRARGL